MASSADRNLLFGILALQMDFVSREQLIAAMNNWVLEKTTPLGEMLCRADALGADERQLLEALVAKHLVKHDNDPEKSLATVSSIGSLRDELRQLADPEIEATLVHVSQDSSAAEQDQHRTLAVGESTSAGLRFRVLRPHAKGGLGEVLVAEDEELHREVALKQIQARFADDPQSRSRFVLEAEITGGLEHPGIVPVYGLGNYANGRPFYAMRFIRGDSLKDAIERFHSAAGAVGADSTRFTSVSFRKLLGRFIDVCNAIEYAHSRGVLHRDLKPGNIMLGKYGETLVVDWGLAKQSNCPETVRPDATEKLLQPASASGSAPTQMGSAVGTPQYMSPEQAAGRLDQLGPLSDVYSLGATMYCLLTGHSPLGEKTNSDVGEILRRVQCGDVRPPCQVNPGIPRPLESICRKAMALSPGERYQSARELADDIERWLADETVAAHRPSWSEQLSRTLGHSSDDVRFADWSGLLFVFAAIMAVMEISVFAIVFRGPPYPVGLILTIRAICLLALAVAFVSKRKKMLLPRNVAERLMWTTWLGFIGGVVLLGVACAELDLLTLAYPFVTVLTGLAFVVMGSSYWGRCHVFGIIFFCLAVIMPLDLRWAVLEYGTVWVVALVTIAMHLRRMEGIRDPAERPGANASSSRR